MVSGYSNVEVLFVLIGWRSVIAMSGYLIMQIGTCFSLSNSRARSVSLPDPRAPFLTVLAQTDRMRQSVILSVSHIPFLNMLALLFQPSLSE